MHKMAPTCLNKRMKGVICVYLPSIILSCCVCKNMSIDRLTSCCFVFLPRTHNPVDSPLACLNYSVATVHVLMLSSIRHVDVLRSVDALTKTKIKYLASLFWEKIFLCLLKAALSNATRCPHMPVWLTGMPSFNKPSVLCDDYTVLIIHIRASECQWRR